jgi:DNA ligase-1
MSRKAPTIPAGSLRFARLKSYRHDKTAADADTIDTVRDIYRRSTGREPPIAPALP